MDLSHSSWDNTPDDQQTKIFLAVIEKHRERSMDGYPSENTHDISFSQKFKIEEVIEEDREEVDDQLKCPLRKNQDIPSFDTENKEVNDDVDSSSQDCQDISSSIQVKDNEVFEESREEVDSQLECSLTENQGIVSLNTENDEVNRKTGIVRNSNVL